MSLWLLTTAVGLGIVQLVAGIVIGRYLLDRSRTATNRHNAERLDRAVRQVFGLIGSVAGDVDKHQAQIRQANQELRTIEADDAQLSSLVLATVARIVDVNEGLRTRLSDAEQQLKVQAEELERHFAAAMTDALTELPNRRAFDTELERRLSEYQAKGTPFSLLMIDVDYFKALNDHFGHPVGDAVLKRMAQVFRNSVGDLDLVARIGGEEFAVLLPRTRLPEANEIADRLRRAVAGTTFSPQLAHLKITISVGVSTVTPGEAAGTLVTRADEALYASKHDGRNCGHYHDGKACQRISLHDSISLGLPAAADMADDERRELNELCGNLRARLAEVAAER
jgi:diguanylate cyclase